MSNLSMTITHELPQEEALSRIKGLLKELQTEHADTISNVEEEWQNDKGRFSFSAKGFDLSGKIQVTPSAVNIDADLPFAVSLFSGKIKSLVTDKAKSLLAK